MPNENLNKNDLPHKSNNFHKIIITQCICCVIVIACVVLMKYFSQDTYAKIKDFYTRYFCYDVSADEVLDSLTDGENSSEIQNF